MFRLRLSLPLLLTLVATACTPAPIATPQPTAITRAIAYSAPELLAGQGMIMGSFIDYAEAGGWTVQTANANGDADTQASQLAFFIDQQPSAIVAVPIDSQGICASVAAATEAGVPFYTIDRAPIGCRVAMTVLSDNFLAGQQAGQALLDLLIEQNGEPRGTILELQGDLRQNVALLRGGGFHQVIDQHPNIQVISRETGWQPASFEQLTRDAIDSETPPDAIYMHSDCVGTPNVLLALRQAGDLIASGSIGHIFIAGVDGCRETLQAIREGLVDQASSQPLTNFGLITDYIARQVGGETLTEGQVTDPDAAWSPATLRESETGWELLLATTSVTSENVDDERLWGNASS